MPSLRDIRRRIQSVKSTRQVTSAMKLVAGARLRRATENAEAARPYAQTLSRVLGRLAASAADLDQPLLQVRTPPRVVELVVFSSDRGLCGGFNGNLLRDVERRVRLLREEGREVRIRTYGRKARDYLAKRGYPVAEKTIGLQPSVFADEARELSMRLREAYVSGAVDEVQLVYNRFVSVISQRPTSLTVLPVTLERTTSAPAGAAEDEGLDYRYEPDPERILGSLLPLYVDTVLLQAFLETEAGEQAARMTAMENATRNATELIDNLTLAYNRARQAAITKELIEIVSGAEAL